MIVARNRTVADVIDEVRPWFGGRIVLVSGDLARRRVDGVYDARDPVQAVKGVIGPSGGTLRFVTPWVMVIS
jgi:transmembrane sensor